MPSMHTGRLDAWASSRASAGDHVSKSEAASAGSPTSWQLLRNTPERSNAAKVTPGSVSLLRARNARQAVCDGCVKRPCTESPWLPEASMTTDSQLAPPSVEYSSIPGVLAGTAMKASPWLRMATSCGPVSTCLHSRPALRETKTLWCSGFSAKRMPMFPTPSTIPGAAAEDAQRARWRLHASLAAQPRPGPPGCPWAGALRGCQATPRFAEA
mmetsp:Transcript_52258/g.167536  ORF Transcript_52258/g.167536 Transcript_52258/m.167536 type:complete len:213 (-) Transcript_52258:1502-2140(-)